MKANCSSMVVMLRLPCPLQPNKIMSKIVPIVFTLDKLLLYLSILFSSLVLSFFGNKLCPRFPPKGFTPPLHRQIHHQPCPGIPHVRVRGDANTDMKRVNVK